MRALPLALLLATLTAAACSGGGSSAPPRVSALDVVAFETRIEVACGAANVADAALADFDADGRADLVVASLDNKVQILLGDGAGGFHLVHSLDVAGGPYVVRTGDLDADRDVDFVVALTGTGVAVPFLNVGGAGFRRGIDFAVGSNPLSMIVADRDGDGALDVLVGSLVRSAVVQFLGRGDGTFRRADDIPLPPGAQPLGLAAGDLDADGRCDLAVADFAHGQVALLYAGAQGVVDEAALVATGAGAATVCIADATNDGRPDLVVSNLEGESLTILRNLPGRKFEARELAVDGPPGHTLVADVTGDGVRDVVACVFSRASCSVFLGQPDGSLGEEIQIGTNGLPFRPVAGSVNSDRDASTDLLVTAVNSDRIDLFLCADRFLATAINHRTGIGTGQAVAAADFDGDGTVELAVGGPGSREVAILRVEKVDAPPGRRLVPLAKVGMPEPVENVVRGDFNRDGLPDLAVSMPSGVKLLANRTVAGRAPAFGPVPAAPQDFLVLARGAFEVAAGDMNGDGRDDLIVVAAEAQELTVLLATDDGFGYEGEPLRTPIAGRPIGLAVADFDGDGLLDAAVSRNVTGAISVLRNTGGGKLAPMVDVPVGAAPNYLRTADFDGDGLGDLVVSNGLSDSITVLIGGKAGTFRAYDVPAGPRPTALLTRDLNRDGFADILVASLLGADFHVLLGDGKGGFPSVLRFPGTYLASSADLADMDGDHLPELAVGSLQTTRVSVYRNVSR
jgi:hypothetical protein